jgi:hypothetical protein
MKTGSVVDVTIATGSVFIVIIAEVEYGIDVISLGYIFINIEIASLKIRTSHYCKPEAIDVSDRYSAGSAGDRVSVVCFKSVVIPHMRLKPCGIDLDGIIE